MEGRKIETEMQADIDAEVKRRVAEARAKAEVERKVKAELDKDAQAPAVHGLPQRNPRVGDVVLYVDKQNAEKKQVGKDGAGHIITESAPRTFWPALVLSANGSAVNISVFAPDGRNYLVEGAPFSGEARRGCWMFRPE